jgi:preprotein translocase subunit SecD
VAAPSGQLKASRYFIALAVILASMYALVFFTGDHKAVPKRGLDLQGGTSMTLSATLAGNKAPDPTRLERARQIISSRVDTTGVSEPDVVTEGDRNIVVSVAGKANQDELRKLVAPAELRFRKVVASTQDTGGAVTPTPSASASGAPSSAPSAPAIANPSSSASPPAAGTSANPSANPSGSASAAPVEPSVERRREAVIAKLGPIYQAAQSIPSPDQVTAEQATLLKPFGELSPDDVAVLPADVQYNVPTITCKQLNGRQPGAISPANQQVVACGNESSAATKYKLDIAKVVGEDVKDAGFTNDPQQGGWITNLSFRNQDKWTNLTREVYGDGSADKQNRRVAIVLDNTVVSDPSIDGVITGDAIIFGQFTREQVVTLSQQLKYGSLPLTFKVESLYDVTPTLGTAGLIAGGIGLLLVIIYCLFYYRALGFVVVLSLGVSGALIYGALVLLGRWIDYSLSLAGIAGFIVAIGITADSFVVFFERLKDEVKDGRTVRSAVPRAWVRARRTILSADMVSFLAAAVLYILAIGAVKGFAFTLGLSTVIDVVIVFLFTHPLVAILARWSAFTSPRMSGLGNVRSDKAIVAGQSAGRLGAVRTKES